MRRNLTISLHWVNLWLLVLLVAAGPIPVLAWIFVATGLGMVALAIMSGLLNGPGPKLEGALRTAHPWLSRGMYTGLAAVTGVTLTSLLGIWTPSVALEDLYFYLLGAASLHGVFHLWRHTALGDGALRRMTPTFLHKML